MSDVVQRARPSARDDRAEAAFRAFVGDGGFPCLAAKGVLRSGAFRIRAYGALGSRRSAVAVARDLGAFVRESAAADGGLTAFVAVFPRQAPTDELAFESRLWTHLQQLHGCDAPGTVWDPSVSADAADPDFSFSFAGRALFVVGMHPASSRLARRFRWPALAFNPHAQFERLRADGRFSPLQAAVRQRELTFQGSLNPNLADFGEQSEARQYSGRAVGTGWTCPFHRTIP